MLYKFNYAVPLIKVHFGRLASTILLSNETSDAHLQIEEVVFLVVTVQSCQHSFFIYFFYIYLVPLPVLGWQSYSGTTISN